MTLCVLGLMTGCATEKVVQDGAEEAFREAEVDVESAHYQIALEKLRALKNKYPYSHYAVTAQLKIADVYFLQEAYAESAASYESFRDLHPRHEKAPCAAFRAAKAYFKDSPGDVAQDLSPVHKALLAYESFLRRYPQESHAGEARQDIQDAKELLARKELAIGDFYFKREFLAAAKPRYLKVVAIYPQSRSAEIAQMQLQKIAATAPTESQAR